MLNSPGTVIRAADGSFELHPSQQVATPFWANSCPLAPSTESYMEALQGGARPVTVMTPFHDQALYGLLSFCPIPHDVTGPAARLHLVQVPQEYVVATNGGLISVVYEPVSTTTPDPTAAPAYGAALCTDTCGTSHDNECDDGGPSSLYNICPLGSDCSDCGPRLTAGADFALRRAALMRARGIAEPGVSRQVPGWILFLSRQPFPNVPMPAPRGGVAGSAAGPPGAP